jgi:DNA-binding NtrC family response regulator
MRDAVADALEAEGFLPARVGSTRGLFTALEFARWDVVILDTLGVRPEEAAFRVLLRATVLAAGRPVILLTGSTAAAQWARETERFAHVVEKPVDLEVLFRVVADAVD